MKYILACLNVFFLTACATPKLSSNSQEAASDRRPKSETRDTRVLLSPVNLDYVEGLKYCANLHAHVPNNREWVELAEVNGLELNYGDQYPRDGRHWIQVGGANSNTQDSPLTVDDYVFVQYDKYQNPGVNKNVYYYSTDTNHLGQRFYFRPSDGYVSDGFRFAEKPEVSLRCLQGAPTIPDLSIYEKNKLRKIVPLPQTNTPTFTNIVKNADGTVRAMTYKEAEVYCAQTNAHIPSPREYALFAMSQGAKGIVEVNDPAYELISKMDLRSNTYANIYSHFDTTDKTDEFRYIYYGYKKPTSPSDGNALFWMSSVAPDSMKSNSKIDWNKFEKHHIFNGSYGGLMTYQNPLKSHKHALRCVLN